ncbi:hypothetical protein CTheo_3206 [Ceratobasidium theobromae]|uniref:Uncharacterized protein n=1 Tax=Ceratobasidium theobromae TaxID=1582974 RepID=A0A5N5QNV9_9AGAM|nr:hypothetical protein CTheo_3206 [Ceratobasidium theobromae]
MRSPASTVAGYSLDCRTSRLKMPTFAGYMMTPEAQVEWLREHHPEALTKEHPIAIRQVLDRLRKVKLAGKFEPHMVVVPHSNHEIPQHERAGLMLARVVCLEDRPVWLPPRVKPGVNDIRAGEVLRKCEINVGDWVVIFQSWEDPLHSSYVYPPSS